MFPSLLMKLRKHDMHICVFFIKKRDDKRVVAILSTFLYNVSNSIHLMF